MAAKMEMDVNALNALDFVDDSNEYSLVGASLLLASFNQTKVKANLYYILSVYMHISTKN